MKNGGLMAGKLLGMVCAGLLFTADAWAQYDVLPKPFEVYGGSVGVMDSIRLAPGKTRLFVSTDSANSVFYADVDRSSSVPFGTNFFFTVLPDMDANANFGAPLWLAAHETSGKVFVGTVSGLVSCAIAGGSLTTLITNPVSFVLIEDDYLFAVGDAFPENPRTLYHGTLSASGSFTPGGSPAATFYGNTVKLAVHPVNRKVYVLASTTTNFTLFKSSADFNAFSAATTFAVVPVGAVTITGVEQLAAGPDGRLFLGGGAADTLYVAWSDDDGATWTNLDTTGLRSGVGSGLNIVCNGYSNAYEVFFGTAVSSNKGENGTWTMMPRPGGGSPIATHVNAGCTAIDALDAQVVYITTDKGVGGSTNAGADLFELNNGLLAFQINAIDALASKTVAWIGSKAGMRYATSFNTINPVWTDGNFPDAIVNCVAIDTNDAGGMTGCAGSHSLYRTTTGGGTNASSWMRVFNRDDFGLPDGIIRSARINGAYMALGYHSYTENSPSGGVYVTTDSGVSWTSVLSNVDVNDLLLREEAGLPVLYAAIAKSKAGDAGGIYRIDGATAMLDLTNAVNITCLTVDDLGDFYATGTVPDTDPARHRVVAYYKDNSSALPSAWYAMTTNGLPGGLWDGAVLGRDLGPSITIGKDSASNDVPVLAAVRTIYYLPYGGSAWLPVTNYPNGTQIKTLFWDELMVGTTIGLYGQNINAQPVNAPGPIIMANNVRNALIVPAGTPVTVSVSLIAGPYAGAPADCWVVAVPRAGAWWYFLDAARVWVPFAAGSLGACTPVYAGPVGDVPATTVLDHYMLARGIYDFYFALDAMDGVLDTSTPFRDVVTVTVE